MVIVFLGFYPKQDTRYWKFAAIAFCFHLFAWLLSGLAKGATNDGEESLLALPFVIGIGWILPIYLINKGYKRKNGNTDQPHS
jgi:hypothetical protein